MPIRDLIIPEASSAIIEPVSQQMVYAVLSRLGLRNTFGDNIYITNDYQKPSLTSDDDHNTLISKNRCDVKMSVSWNPSETKWDVNSFNYTQSYGTTMLLDRSLVPIFNDGVSGVQITEHQLPCSMILEFSLQFKDRELAFLAFSAIANTSLKDSVINVHNLSYSYPVGMDMFKAINQIYQLRKSSLVLPFWDYLQRCSCGAIQYIQQRTGDLVELVIKRHDLRTMGVLEYNQTAPTVIDQDRGVDRFVVEFTYTIQFARPDALRLSFPVVICNQMVPLWMIPKPVVSETSKLHGILQEHSLSWYLKSISTHQQVVTRLPSYDDFRPPYEPVVSAGFVEFFDAVVMLDDTDTTTINLLDLGDVQLHEKVVEIMKLEGSDIFSTKSLINLTVYCNDIPVDNTLLSIDNNLVLTISIRNKYKRYHLVLSEATNLRSLDYKWFKTLIAYRTFFPITIIRNLQKLIDMKYCYIDNHNEVLLLINNKINDTTIDDQIATLIIAGHLTHYAYSYTSTAEQLSQYLMHYISPISDVPVYDEYVKLCMSAGLLKDRQLYSGYIRTYRGYPFLSGSIRGVIPRFNIPLRVIDANICTSNFELT